MPNNANSPPLAGNFRGEFTEALMIARQPDPTLVELEEALALTRLAKLDGRKVRIMELMFFGDLNQSEVAELLGLSESKVGRELRMASACCKRPQARGYPLCLSSSGTGVQR